MQVMDTIVAAIIGNSVVLAVLGWLAKSLIGQLLARDSKRFEAALEAKAAITMETFKSELQLRTVEHQVRFSKLHEKRATVIAELNAMLAEVLWSAESLLIPIQWTGEPELPEKARAAERTLIDFFRYFEKHRIYLPAAVCPAVENLVRQVRSKVIDFSVLLDDTPDQIGGG